MISQSNVSRGSEISSRSSEIGRISSSANLRAVICQERCSLLSVKSMGCALVGSFGRERGAHRRAGDSRRAPRRCAAWRRCCSCRNAGRPAHRARISAAACRASRPWRRSIPRRPWWRGRSPPTRTPWRCVASGRSGRLRSANASGWSQAQAACQMAARATSSRTATSASLCSDRLVLDDAAAALHAQLRVVERRLVGGAADAEIERRGLRWIAARHRRRAGFHLRCRQDSPPAPGSP